METQCRVWAQRSNLTTNLLPCGTNSIEGDQGLVAASVSIPYVGRVDGCIKNSQAPSLPDPLKHCEVSTHMRSGRGPEPIHFAIKTLIPRASLPIKDCGAVEGTGLGIDPEGRIPAAGDTF